MSISVLGVSVSKSIDLVSIASYDNYHFQHAIKCIAKNKHIFIEKPFCQNFNQYRAHLT